MHLITESEEVIMNLLWDNGKMSVMQIVRELQNKKGWSKQSVISFLRRMEQKGTVSYVMQGRTKFYFAVVQRNEVVKEETRGILNRFFGGRLGAMVSYMASESELTKEDIQELRDFLQELKEEDNGKRD